VVDENLEGAERIRRLGEEETEFRTEMRRKSFKEIFIGGVLSRREN
jgi:hypothetical protein